MKFEGLAILNSNEENPRPLSFIINSQESRLISCVVLDSFNNVFEYGALISTIKIFMNAKIIHTWLGRFWRVCLWLVWTGQRLWRVAPVLKWHLFFALGIQWSDSVLWKIKNVSYGKGSHPHVSCKRSQMGPIVLDAKITRFKSRSHAQGRPVLEHRAGLHFKQMTGHLK